MPDDIYRTDIVTWSRQQAALLRRHLAGERVNGLDWAHVIEEIEDRGNSEIAAVSSLILQAMIHALKIARWPGSSAVPHWHGEAGTFLVQAQARYRPSMARSLSVEDNFRKARRLILSLEQDGPTQPLPDQCGLTLAALMDEEADLRALVEAIGSGVP